MKQEKQIKTHGKTSDIRYFYNIKTKTGDKTVYRSRHATTEGVRGYFRSLGITLTSCTPVKV